MEKERGVYLISIAAYLGIMGYAVKSGVTDYVNDVVVSIMLITLLYVKRKSFAITPWLLGVFAGALLLHNSGVFGWYNQSPVGIQWDHITHGVGFFAIALISLHMGTKKAQMKTRNLLALIVLVNLGIGVLVELYEFTGFLLVGEGQGGLGHGEGDVESILGKSEWFNTMFDFIWNLIGTSTGILVYSLIKKKP